MDLKTKQTHKTIMTTIYQTTVDVMPKCFPDIYVASKDTDMQNLQQKMIDNGWEPEETDGVIQFTHNAYKNKIYPCHTYTTLTGEKLMLPISSQLDDPKGLACDIQPIASGYSTIVNNEWVSYWDTRKGKRREKYYKYLDAREKKKEEILEEQKKTAVIPNIF